MSPAQPDGVSWPMDGALDPALAGGALPPPLSLYVHVPFCRVRCGYCDFNTYTTGFGPGAEPGDYASTVLAEADLAVRVLADADLPQRPASTLFVGGGTPTMLAASELARILEGLRARIGIDAGAEVTIEANPETVDAAYLQALAEAGATRMSFGMQSAVERVLRTLDRVHTSERVPEVVAAAKDNGLDVSVDLIYGTPGESLDDWRRSVEAAIALEPHHISAYALVVEDGTKMGAQVARGRLPAPDPDDEAAKYEAVNAMLAGAGYRWYEISNFARVEPGEETLTAADLRHASRHNLAYWRDWDWWGFGPGAHSHVGRYRWWNVKHPRTHAGRLAAGMSPAAAGEVLDEATRKLEKVMLAIRTAEGAAVREVAAPRAVAGLVADGLVEDAQVLEGRIVLTLRGRLLADHVTRELMAF